MKRISALVCVIMMAMTLVAPVFAANNDDGSNGTASSKSQLTIVESSPEDGATGVAVDNLSVKIKFSKEMLPSSDKIRTANAKQFVLRNSDGDKIPTKVYYSDEEEGLVLVAADTYSNKKNNNAVKGDEEYTLTIGKSLTATDGTTLGTKQTITMTTLNQSRSTVIYMILMALMMGGMVFFAVRGSKKDEKKEKEERELKEGVNPYKEAKKSGKSVEEIVAKESKKKAKKEEAIRKQKEAEAAIEAEIIEKIRKESNKRVSKPKTIASAGSKVKIKVINDAGKQVEAKKSQAEQAKNNKGTTRPKNQSGKKKNKKKK